MPSKGRRAASRQAGLKKRRKRGKGGGQVFEAAPIVSTQDVDDEEHAEDAEPESAAPPARPARAAIRASRATQAAAAEAAAEQPYLGAELKRIGVVTGVIFVILAIASVLLG